MAPTRKKKSDPSTQSLDEMSDSAKPRANGVKTGSAHKLASAKNTSSAGKDRAVKKLLSKRLPSKDDDSSKKKQNRKNDGTSPSAAKKRKAKSDSSAKTANSAGVDGDSSEDEGDYPRIYSQLPTIGDEIAIKCPPDPPYPEGWYTCVVLDIVVHEENELGAAKKSNDNMKDFTLYVEWDGGGEEALRNPEWRMKGDAPDKQGRVSHRDAKLRPYFKYWVNRLNSMGESEKKLSRTRAGKSTRVDPGQMVEWIQCSNPSCGKWRPLPTYMKSSAVLESCNSKWFCVLNSWDEAVASCGAPQEIGRIPAK